jgi:dimethylargininase
MNIAITRPTSSTIGNCELTYLPRKRIDVEKAARQHQAYNACLAQFGVQVLMLPVQHQFPDAVFIEDTAVVVDEVAIVTRMGTPTRRRETRAVSDLLVKYRPIQYIIAPATVEGGDVIQVDRTLYVGVSNRTNERGVSMLRTILAPYDYRVVAVPVKRCLHLSTGCSYLGQCTILANPAWVDTSKMKEFVVIETPKAEPWGANVLKLGDVIVTPDGFPQTRKLLEEQGFKVITLDISEFQKAEGGLSCLSLRMNAGRAAGG